MGGVPVNTMLAVGLVLLSPLLAIAQQPFTLVVAEGVVGSHRLETRYAAADGKWSDAPKNASILSTDIECFERFGFCEVADAIPFAGQATVAVNSFDILRWDDKEMIAVDSSSLCVVMTLRLDFVAKKVSLSSASKSKADNLCEGTSFRASQTVFLTGLDDKQKRIEGETSERKKGE